LVSGKKNYKQLAILIFITIPNISALTLEFVVFSPNIYAAPPP
jgi:hypothetical protein